MMKEIHASVLVTKETSRAGGFPEKVRAAISRSRRSNSCPFCAQAAAIFFDASAAKGWVASTTTSHSRSASSSICLYNPSSRKRADYLKRACDILLAFRKESNLCGLVKNIGREGTESLICTLQELRDIQTDMFTTVFIGNSGTREVQGKLVTPRGYIL